jgi:hypothetical protein
VLVAQNVNELIGCPCSFDLGVVLGILVVYGDDLAVEHNFDVAVATRARGAKLVRTAQLHLSGTGELDFLQSRRDYLDIGVVGDRYRFLARYIVRHPLENLPRAVFLSIGMMHAPNHHGHRQRCRAEAHSP